MFANPNIQFYLLGYLVGGIPFGFLLAKYFGKVNIREVGSRSVGGTNVLRALKETNPTLAKKLAFSTVLLDASKGLAVIALASLMGFDAIVQWTIGVCAVLGHCFSPYLKFEGGKGVATAVGVMVWFLPLEVLLALIAWVVLGKTLKISSVSSLGALVVFIISSYIFHANMPQIQTHAPIFIISFIIVYKHIPNIIRLFSGQEKRVI
ncbi:MAG: acyl-phosphate--glycerol-3-phosphate O-acyltransferase [Proteobacteria bacterium]|nr:MAG: acyl-phosphate--glycerol-3-phosphate O-acyltransferase [Pseudomonadota bacterium]